MLLLAAVLAGCAPGLSIDRVERVPCASAGEEGLAVWIRGSARPRHGEQMPVIVRVNPPTRDGFEASFPVEPLLEQGAAVVRFLDPGTASGVHASGGVADPGGPGRLEAIACVVEHARDALPASAVILTGVSLGGNHALLAWHEGAAADGVVLWESPLVDQIVLSEPSPGGVVDPSFTPGTCTLDEGCPFPGRAEALRMDGQAVFHDLDGDGLADADEPRIDPHDGRAFSVEVHAEIAANEAVLFPEGLPEDWPAPADVEAFWASRDATEALLAVREGGGGRFLYVASEQDHVQVFHEHVRLAQEGLLGADFFRLNPDLAYVEARGGILDEVDAGASVDVYAPGALPEIDDEVLVLAAELELADRVAAGRWEPDLDETLY